MKVQLGICGAGRMGRAILSVLETERCFEGVKFELAGMWGRNIFDAPVESVDVWVDFSEPQGTEALLGKGAKKILVGTTGHTPDQVRQIRRHAEQFPVLIAPNTSLGVHLLMKWLGELPKGMGRSCVTEVHHRFKRDRPSGTALALGRVLEARGWPQGPIQSVREGEVLGMHEIELNLVGERLTLRHEALDRSLFAKGALQGAAFLAKVSTPRVYSMQEVFS